jgi:DUF438 domain-containing protein
VPGLPAGHPVHTLMLENRACEGILNEAEAIKDFSKEKTRLLDILDRFGQLDKHYLHKENQLYQKKGEEFIFLPVGCIAIRDYCITNACQPSPFRS